MKLRPRKKLTDSTERRRPTSVSPAVFSYYARSGTNTDQNTGRNEASRAPKAFKRLHLRLGYVPSYIAFVALVAALIHTCLLQPNPKIILVSTSGTVHRNAQDYQDAAQSIWKKSLFSRSKLTVSTDGIERTMQSQFEELASVQVELPLLGRRPTMILTPATPALQLISNNGVFYVDESGKIMARITDVSGNEIKNMPLVRDETGTPVEVGKNIFSGPEAIFLKQLYTSLITENIAVESITLPKTAANEADVRVTGQQYYIKFSIGSDARQAVGTYLAAKAKLDTEGTVPAEYMDVRVEEKVFYR